MKIAILGTRGIPNRYGGFEQWAEQLSVGLVNKDCGVTVYNSHFHPYKNDKYQGVKLVHRWDPKKIGLASQFIYDLLCILHARRQNYDAILQLGYTTSSIWAWLLPKKSRIIYNMDGMEWKREKYKGLLSSFLKYAEKLAVKYSDAIIADSQPIKKYLDKKYNINSSFIAYPAEIFNQPDESVLKEYDLKPEDYYLLIARFQPDNNLETVIKGVLDSSKPTPLIIVGDHQNRYGNYLKNKYNHKRIVFLGKIYDKRVLNNLRYFSFFYFHGHSSGGTNPSLLEAMAASCVICAHDNEFNRSITEMNAFYFKTEEDINDILNRGVKKPDKSNWIKNNLNKLRDDYDIDKIVNDYYHLLTKQKEL